MTNLSRITAKIFGETATATGDDPEIGQFGSALAGTYVGTNDVATIQNLPAWSNGFIDSVTPSTQFPPLPEMTGFGKVLSYQTAYTMQKGVAEWDASTTYYTGDFCKGVGEGKLYVSKVDSNLNHAVTNSTYWKEFLSDKADVDLSNLTATVSPNLDGQWISSSLGIANEVTAPTETNLNYSLSSYLPNDGYNYEVLFRGFGVTGTTSGDRNYFYLTTDIIQNISLVSYIRTRSAASLQSGSTLILPVGTSRRVTIVGTGTQTNTGTVSLSALGYRRIGTNS